jgi:RNA polymerase sigma factor for flagellar operon FliA
MSIGPHSKRGTASTARLDSSSPAAADSEAQLLAQLGVARRVARFVCSRHRLSADETDEFSAHVNLKLLEDDRAILRKFAGRSSISTYLAVVIERLYLDFRVAAWGKWRPSAEACRQGDVAVLAERLIVRDGCSVEEAYESLTTNHQVAIDRAGFDRLLGRLPVRVRRRFEGEDSLALEPDAGLDPEQALLRRQHDHDAVQVTRLLKQAIAGLPPRDRLMLTLRYEDGRSVAQIAAMLGDDQKRLYRQFETLLRQIRGSLTSAGISAADVARLFDHTPMDPGAAEEAAPRPSRSQGAESGAE